MKPELELEKLLLDVCSVHSSILEVDVFFQVKWSPPFFLCLLPCPAFIFLFFAIKRKYEQLWAEMRGC